MKYSELTKEQHKKRQELWEQVLNKYCPADKETGNRPCDNGVLCDYCHFNYEVQFNFWKLLEEHSLKVEDEWNPF